LKKPFVVFIIVMTVLVSTMIGFIQSRPFANIVKRTAAKYLPADIGIEGDFSEFAVKLFPPGISIRNPRIVVTSRNIAGLPPGSSLIAEGLDLSFRPFQMFSGNIRIHEVTVVNGDVRLAFGKAPETVKKKHRPFNLRWDELLQVRAEAVALRDTHLNITFAEPAVSLELTAHSLRLGQWASKSGIGYDTVFEIRDVRGTFPKGWPIPAYLEQIRGAARVNAEGVNVEEFAVLDKGIELKTSGKIRGNILQQSDLKLDAAVKLKGPLNVLAGYLKSGSSAHKIQGDLSFEGKALGNLVDLTRTLHTQGKLLIQRAYYQNWSADQVEAEVSWAPNTRGGEISVGRAVITSTETPRAGGKPGLGGRIETGSFKIPLDSIRELTIPVRLEHAHLHWLAIPALEDLYPLDLRLTGTVLLNYTGARGQSPWSLHTKSDLTMDHLQLDNQRHKQTRQLHKILSIPGPIRLAGELLIDSAGVRPLNMELTLAHSKLHLNGTIDSHSNYDLQASGPIDLADLHEIAENPIRGQGTLNAFVHGPSSAVMIDFDADLKRASYLNLDLGSLKGRITWDDDHQKLLFTNVHLEQGKTPYVGTGFLDLGTAHSINLGFQIARGYVQDISTIMKAFTKDIWWFPNSLIGAFTGTINVTGGLGIDKLKVLAKTTGADWEYMGERFKNLSLTGGYKEGTYYLGDFMASKRSGKVFGRISYDPFRKLDWDVRTEQLVLTDLDFFARLDVPMRGKITISSSGRGVFGTIISENFFSLTDFSVRGTPLAPSQLSVTTAEGMVSAKGTALGGQGILEMGYDFKPGNESFVRSEFKHFDYSPVLLLLNPMLSQDPELEARVSGSMNMTFRSAAADRGSGNLAISEFLLRKSNTRFELLHPTQIKVRDGSFEFKNLGLKGNQGEARLNLTSNNTQLEGSLLGEIDISATEFLTSTVTQASGTALLDFAIGGFIREPKVIGKTILNSGSVRIAAVESPFENITGMFQLRQNTVTVQNLEADLAGGRVGIDGSIQLFADRYPELALHAQLSGPKLKIYPFQYLKLSGGLDISGHEVPYLIKGGVTVDSGLLREKVMQQKQAGGLKSAQYMPHHTSQSETGYPKFKLQIDAHADRGIFIQNDLFDAEAKGKVTIVNTIETPRIIGTAGLIQGKMIFKNRTFQIQSANANFDNPTTINPLFDLTASTDVDNTKIQLYASGRVSSWRAELTSNPVLPESEILSLLTMGISPNEAKRLSSTDRSLVEQGEAASLLLHSLDFNREVHSKTGFQIQLGESVDSQTGTSITRPQSQGETAAAPKIVIKKQIGKNLDLSYGSTVGLGTNNRKEVNAEYHVTPGFSVIGVWDNYESPDVQQKKSYGMDLKFQKRFK